jgi:ribosomal-protein-serine acetyltransferase
MDASKLRFDLGAGIYLRCPREEDVKGVFAIVEQNYEHLRTFMEWAKPDYSEVDAREWLERAVGSKDAINFLICRGEKIIGTIGFATFDNDARVTEIGYWIDKAEEGRGIMSRACRRLIEFAFDELGMDRIQIRCASANVRSAAIPDRLGFQLEGTQRQHVMRNGKIYDFLIYGLLRSEWRNEGDGSPSQV